MQKHFLKFSKVFANITCSPLIFLSNNSELAANDLPKDFEPTVKTLEINNNFKFEDFKKFTLNSQTIYRQDELEYDILFNDEVIKSNGIISKNTSIDLKSKIEKWKTGEDFDAIFIICLISLSKFLKITK